MSDDLSVYDIPFSKLESSIMKWVEEALELRHGAANDPDGKLVQVDPTEGPQAVTAMLVRVRTRSDRVDFLLARTTQARGRAKRVQDQAKFAAEQAFDQATQNNAARRTISFSTREERNADAKLDSLEERRQEFLTARLVSITSEAYEVVNQIHWQLDAIRKDLRATLHALQFESSLER